MKVLVIGLRREQNEKLRQRFNSIEIVALNDQALHHKPVKNAKTFDRIISVTKFTNHTTHKHYKRYSVYTMVAGGFSSVAAVLATLLSYETKNESYSCLFNNCNYRLFLSYRYSARRG